MIARLILGFVLTSTVLIARPAIAQSPYFDEYIDHAKFVELSPQDQRDFLVALMQTVADMEQKSIQAGHHTGPLDEKKTVHQRRWDAVRKALKSFQDQLAISSAVADPTPPYAQTCFNPGQAAAEAILENGAPASCLFGSYRSTYVRSGNTTYCQRPGCSKNEEIRAAYSKVAHAGRCSKSQIACNPALFGYDNSGTATRKPTCIQIDINNGQGTIVNTVQNASLACLIAVANDRTKDLRLSDIAKSIKDNAATAQEFNKLLHTISNLCICDGSVGNAAAVPQYLRDMSNIYSKYVKDHRTCNALLSQTSEVLRRVSAGGGCVADILPNNVKKLSSDLNYINTYSSRFLLLARSNAGIANEGALSQAQIHSAMARYSKRWVVDNSFSKTTDESNRPILQTDITRVNEAGALDDIASYMQSGAALKARGSSGENSWCPLRFPEPVVAPELNLTCEILNATATRGEGNKVSLAATVDIKGVPAGVTSTISWTVDGSAVEGQAAATINIQDIDGIDPEATSVPVVATYTLPNGTTKECPGFASFPPAPGACTITETVTPGVDGANPKISVTVTPANPALVVKFGSTAVALTNGKYETTAPTSQGTVEVSASAPAAAGAVALACSKSITLTAPAQPACSITIEDVTPHTGGKFKASVAATFTSINPDAVTWTPNEVASGTAGAVDRTRQVVFSAPTGDPREVRISIIGTTGTQRAECSQTKALPAAAADEPCTIVPSVVLGNEGKYSVSLSLDGATDRKAPEGEPTYTGFDFRTSGGVGIAIVTPETAPMNKTVSASYSDKDGKRHSCSVSIVIPAKAPAAGGGGGAAPAGQGTTVIEKVGVPVFKRGLK